MRIKTSVAAAALTVGATWGGLAAGSGIASADVAPVAQSCTGSEVPGQPQIYQGTDCVELYQQVWGPLPQPFKRA